MTLRDQRNLVDIDSRLLDELTPIETANVRAVVDEIRQTDRAKLLDRDWLEMDLLPRLGLNDEWIQHFPTALHRFCGKGVKSWQYPCQFAGYLVQLADKNIKSYLEIGVRHGGTFIITCEYLQRFSNLDRIVAIDPFHSGVMTAYQDIEPRVEYITSLSHEPLGHAAIESQLWDHVLIDGDHSLQGCLTDFLLVKDKARRIALHDVVSFTTPGVISVWDAIRQVTPSRRIFEQTQQYAEIFGQVRNSVMGIGVVELI